DQHGRRRGACTAPLPRAADRRAARPAEPFGGARPPGRRSVAGMSEAPGMPAETPAAPPDAPEPRRPEYRLIALVLAASLLLIVALVGTAPLWAPQLPWAASLPDPAFEQRLARLEAAERQRKPDETAAATAHQALDKRLAALEAKPAPPPP